MDAVAQRMPPSPLGSGAGGGCRLWWGSGSDCPSSPPGLFDGSLRQFVTFSWFILSRNLLGGCVWLSVSKCLGTLQSRGLGSVLQPEAGGNAGLEAGPSKLAPASFLGLSWVPSLTPARHPCILVPRPCFALCLAERPSVGRVPPSLPRGCLRMGGQRLGMWQYPRRASR